MKSDMFPCAKVQERIALGEQLPDSEQIHLSGCERCTRVAETYSLLDASLESLAEPVPSAFADRVMNRIAEHELARPTRWFHAGWAELALANAALAGALLNTLRFLADVLIPSVSLGGTP
jgi:hypothetical protein